MTKLSANLGFLWKDLPLPDAISAAAAAGFDAVECHWPYQFAPDLVSRSLTLSGLTMLSLNTFPGDLTRGDFGLAAVPGRETEARQAIRDAIDYAGTIGAGAVHVMAGNAAGPMAHRTFVQNLRFACRLAVNSGVDILIEPLNRHDAPGYFLKTLAQARRVMDDVRMSHLRLMFDCYHVARTEGDVLDQLRRCLDDIGHIQIAGVPDRGPPNQGEFDYRPVFDLLRSQGWARPLGAEYVPRGTVEDVVEWAQRETF